MVGRRQKKTALATNTSEGETYNNCRRSSMQVNLSFLSNFSDSENISLKKNIVENKDTEVSLHKISSRATKINRTPKSNVNDITATSASSTNITVITVSKNITGNCKVTSEISNDYTLSMIKEKEQLLNRSCESLKNAIMTKTKAIFDTGNELAIKITEVLEPGLTLQTHQLNDEQDLRSPSIRVNIGKNDQIVMSGDGRRKNPVQVNSMQTPSTQQSEKNPCSESSIGDDMDCRSIASTPKISTIEKRNKSFHKTSEKRLRIPVARLFTDDNDDPNNSLSEVEPIRTLNNLPKNIFNNFEQSTANVTVSEKLNETSYSTSPILSQGNRKARISHLSSLKKKAKKTLTETNKTNESFFGRKPLTCSSFIEKHKEKDRSNPSSEISRTVNLKEKSKSINNGVTIDLENEKTAKTIEVDSSTDKSSCTMDITAISSNMPIVRRSFQHIIRRSLNLDDMTTTQNAAQILNTSLTKQTSLSVKKNEEIEIKSLEHLSKDFQKDYTTNIDLMSLNVNTSLDPINSDDNIVQKENKKPNHATETSNNSKNLESENNSLILRQSSDNGSSKEELSLTNSVKKSKVANSQEKKEAKANTKHKKKDNDALDLPSCTSTARSSLQVNTSLDPVQKPSVTKNDLDFNKLLSMIQENSSTENQSKISEYSKNQSSSDSEMENVSLMQRIRNISAKSKTNSLKKSINSETNKRRKSITTKNDDVSTSENCKKEQNISKKESVVKNKKIDLLRKSEEVKNMANASSSTESSVVETTPFPASRSFLLKTMIKNSIATSTLNPRKFVDFTDEEDSCTEAQVTTKKTVDKVKIIGTRKKTCSESSSDTVMLDSSDESDKEKERVIIDETLNETRGNRSKNGEKSNSRKSDKKIPAKRKLYPVRENSQVSFSSMMDIEADLDLSKEKLVEPVKTKKRKVVKKKKIEVNKVSDNPDCFNDNVHIKQKVLPKKIEKTPKKPRKIVSKKIIVKKANNMTILDDLLENNQEAEAGPRLSNRNSLNEFDFRKRRSCRTKSCKSHKIVIVVTGLSNEDKSLVKTVIKTLGSAVLEPSVTPRTTHVVSAGTRTINLLKAIIRGCWLLSMEWVLKSLENEQWLEPGPYEMVHFSKAVQENRRDRQLFGKAYVPELFVTCGFIYIENGTSPPAPVLKELVKTAGGRITENPDQAQIEIGSDGLKENWILDSITTGELQPIDEYKRN